MSTELRTQAGRRPWKMGYLVNHTSGAPTCMQKMHTEYPGSGTGRAGSFLLILKAAVHLKAELAEVKYNNVRVN